MAVTRRKTIVYKNLDDIYAEKATAKSSDKQSQLFDLQDMETSLSKTELNIETIKAATNLQRMTLMNGDMENFVETQKRVVKLYLSTGFLGL